LSDEGEVAVTAAPEGEEAVNAWIRVFPCPTPSLELFPYYLSFVAPVHDNQECMLYSEKHICGPDKYFLMEFSNNEGLLK
jgi:hypothetical protein